MKCNCGNLLTSKTQQRKLRCTVCEKAYRMDLLGLTAIQATNPPQKNKIGLSITPTRKTANKNRIAAEAKKEMAIDLMGENVCPCCEVREGVDQGHYINGRDTDLIAKVFDLVCRECHNAYTKSEYEKIKEFKNIDVWIYCFYTWDRMKFYKLIEVMEITEEQALCKVKNETILKFNFLTEAVLQTIEQIYITRFGVAV